MSGRTNPATGQPTPDVDGILSKTVPIAMAGQDSSTERVRAYRRRLAEGQKPQLGTCLACGREVRKLLQTTRDGSDELLCRSCWDRSPSGKAAGAARKRAQRAAKKAQQQDQGQG